MKYQYWLYSTSMGFVVRYRKTLIGPLWMMVGPAIFITLIGVLYAQINQSNADIFVPFMAVGYVVWTLISGFVNGSTTIFQRFRAQILQGELNLIDIVMVGVFTTILQFLHQIIIIFIVFISFDVSLSPYALVSLFGLFIIMANGIWLSVFFGIIGARYRDFPEMILALMRIAFLATPVIWIPAEGSRGIMGKFALYNPFYHFIEIFRAPLLGNPISTVTWIVTLGITVAGFGLAYLFIRRFERNVVLWI